MTSGVVGMRSHMSAIRELNSFGINGTTSDRIVFSVEDMKKYAVQLLEQLDALMAEDICDHKSSHKLIAKVCRYLKSEGSRLDEDIAFKQQLDLYFDLLRNIIRKPKLSPFARTMILEVIELRAINWSPNEDIEDYYRRKMAEFEANESYCLTNDLSPELQKSQSFVSSAIGSDHLKSAPKLNKCAKVSAKTFIRDEVLIRNGDSGKVTAGAKERLVQITGPNEESIERAKELIETTIKRNASPVPFECTNRSFETNFSQNTTELNTTPLLESTPIQRSEPIITASVEPQIAHTFTVEVNNDVIHLSTTNYELGLRAQSLLKESLVLDTSLKAIRNCERHQSFTHSYSGEELDKELIPKTDTKREVMAALDSVSKGTSVEPKVNRIQRSLSQGTVPIGRTSLRFMSKSVGHESAPKITYERQFLMECSELPLSKSMPNVEVMSQIYKKTPQIIRKHYNSGEGGNSWVPINNPLNKSQSFTQSKVSVDTWD